ncbi:MULTISPECIES: PsiF family protein [Acetobacterales]|uniref:PsiF family protein n=1 Tax=Roseomonas sp. WGS1072 TaxID=3366816 RepID=UPI003BF26517
MKIVLAALAAAAVLLPTLSEAAPRKAAAEPSPARLAQQERMRGCNATAREQSLRGQGRKDFMRTCLSHR